MNDSLNISVASTVLRLREHYQQGLMRAQAFRKQQLQGLLRFINECENDIQKALFADLGKSAAEALATEIALTASEIEFAIKHLASWMRPQRVATSLAAMPAKSYIYPEPLGVVLIIAPWNYPFMLMLTPLIGALAAGNTAVLKPSEMAPATSRLLAEKLPLYVDAGCVAVVEGGVPETTALLTQEFDHIFYTGNGAVGRIVMTAAAKHLTPVTLELGGKSPCIIDQKTDLAVAARRIIWGKFCNAGQTCIAPDYLLVDEAVHQPLLAELKMALHQFYGSDPSQSKDYGRIINTSHYRRLMALLDGAGEVVTGGQGDEAQRYIAPTIVINVPLDAKVMADEIFGPILPVITVKSIEAAIQFINARPKPLALYLFSNDAKVRDFVIANTSSGSLVIGYPLMQMTVPNLPFGGVGASGMGAYHGKASFDTFTHEKSVLVKAAWPDISLLYPPYSQLYQRLVRWLFM